MQFRTDMLLKNIGTCFCLLFCVPNLYAASNLIWLLMAKHQTFRRASREGLPPPLANVPNLGPHGSIEDQQSCNEARMGAIWDVTLANHQSIMQQHVPTHTHTHTPPPPPPPPHTPKLPIAYTTCRCAWKPTKQHACSSKGSGRIRAVLQLLKPPMLPVPLLKPPCACS